MSAKEEDGTNESKQSSSERMKYEGNVCIGTGVGVGVLGAAGAAFLGAVCPLCVVVPPLLIGTGVVQHVRARLKESSKREDLEKSEKN